MGTLELLAPSVAVRQAQALLRAWVCGDLCRLEAELERSAFISSDFETGPGDEHLELLKTLAFTMKSRPDPFAERKADPRLGLCVDLLMHLASNHAATTDSAPTSF